MEVDTIRSSSSSLFGGGDGQENRMPAYHTPKGLSSMWDDETGATQFDDDGPPLMSNNNAALAAVHHQNGNNILQFGNMPAPSSAAPLPPPLLPALTKTNNRRHEHNIRVGFFDLPLEIRLQIYELVNIANPKIERQLDPGYPNVRGTPYPMEAVVAATVRQEADDDDDDWAWVNHNGEIGNDKTKQPAAIRKTVSSPVGGACQQHQNRLLLPANRPTGHIPNALLTTCRRVYKEARCVPFHENEFTYVTCFSSGTSQALAFVNGLRVWQWAAMRHVRLEISARDLDGTDKQRLANWEALCEKWAFGLRGLRLTIIVIDEKTFGSTMDWTTDDNNQQQVYPWVDRGLKKLEALRSLEVELKTLATTALTDERKLDWCEGLRRRLLLPVPGRGGSNIDVVCVKKAPAVVESMAPWSCAFRGVETREAYVRNTSWLAQ
ncbi:hypothetical protein B0H66DRAFT_6771 [Apodospora peruviana]|uniref:Uncharacterized protein n=1 Tax=Apodospora peruviana TaxID=516989 RepID=A0AAE0MDV0_9PEZI|nr:hypothetical protein B0H66DRAFT_6771 [Apodospora peruviana]